MNKKGLMHIGALFIGLAIASSAGATPFTIAGKIKRILVDDVYYSGCMVYLDKSLGNSCPSRWVSLDCKGLFNGKNIELGKQKMATAIAAAHNNKTVVLYVNNSHKVNNYCVARRIDTVF
ncbi:MAG TPA: hypothetical protein EYG71_00010 [Leucothrix sp.]|nr:hypothetical protein [Leucothrix sp.]